MVRLEGSVLGKAPRGRILVAEPGEVVAKGVRMGVYEYRSVSCETSDPDGRATPVQR